ncbi:MAG: hypothetical protein U9N63_00855 [Pseudomonadota bacterium]|nr:hypothetical protein [Pseudomonadota bacterium]
MDEEIKRVFYEVVCILGNWSVRELKRQISSLYYERSVVEYALAGMDNNLFVSKYLLQLPKKDEMERFIEEKIREIG